MPRRPTLANSIFRFGTAFVFGLLIHGQAAASGPVFQSLQLLKGVANGGQPWAPPIF
jgi:hypothetical protein